MATLKTRTVEFSIESFVFLFDFVQKIIEDSNTYIENYFERLEYVASTLDDGCSIYNHEKKSFKESKDNIINFSPIYEMLLGIHDFNALKIYYDQEKENNFMKKISLMEGAKKLANILKDQGFEIQGV